MGTSPVMRAGPRKARSRSTALVADDRGRDLGPVRDIRLAREDLRVVGLVVGGGPLAGPAHAWGYTEGRAQGPWLLRALTAPARRQARFIPAERVSAWGPGVVTITTGELADTEQLP